MANQVLPNLLLGDWQDALGAKSKGWDTLCVIETLPEDRYKGMTYYVPILEHDEYSLAFVPIQARIHELDECAKIIDWYAEKDGSPLLVHCYAGIERSPLTLAWWLVKTKRRANLDGAYRFLKHVRPIVEDRRIWLPPTLASDL